MTEQTQLNPEEIVVDGDGVEPPALDQERQRLAEEKARLESAERSNGITAKSSCGPTRRN